MRRQTTSGNGGHSGAKRVIFPLHLLRYGPTPPFTRSTVSLVLNSSITRLRVVGFLEGTSFLLLLLVAMPLKYIAGRPEMVSMVGSAHGLLFLLYVAALANAAVDYRWPIRRVFVGLVASVLPGGPFVFDRQLRHERIAAA